jgi:hypothetical protein
MVQLPAFERTETNLLGSKQKELSRNSVLNDSLGNTLCCNVWPVDVWVGLCMHICSKSSFGPAQMQQEGKRSDWFSIVQGIRLQIITCRRAKISLSLLFTQHYVINTYGGVEM